jgi:hypothetical protein
MYFLSNRQIYKNENDNKGKIGVLLAKLLTFSKGFQQKKRPSNDERFLTNKLNFNLNSGYHS